MSNLRLRSADGRRSASDTLPIEVTRGLLVGRISSYVALGSRKQSDTHSKIAVTGSLALNSPCNEIVRYVTDLHLGDIIEHLHDSNPSDTSQLAVNPKCGHTSTWVVLTVENRYQG